MPSLACIATHILVHAVRELHIRQANVHTYIHLDLWFFAARHRITAQITRGARLVVLSLFGHFLVRIVKWIKNIKILIELIAPLFQICSVFLFFFCLLGFIYFLFVCNFVDLRQSAPAWVFCHLTKTLAQLFETC